MDLELRAYLDEVRQTFNDGQERPLNRIALLEVAFQNTKSFLINDAIVGGRRWINLDKRVACLERD